VTTIAPPPQGIGDIEEVNGRACLVCPWHYYKVGPRRRARLLLWLGTRQWPAPPALLLLPPS
jgi:hypothetical protein